MQEAFSSVDVKKEIRAHIIGALKGAKFPLKTPAALLKAFPMGAETTCEAGNVKMTAGEAGKLLKPEDFPLKDAAQIADTILKRAEM
jgi:hypothetical protein